MFAYVYIWHPICSNSVIKESMCAGLISLIVISPFVIAAAEIYVAAAILSGIIRYSQPVSFLTPHIHIVLSPAPLILAPHLFRKHAKSTISGSLAAFFIIVSPSAKTAASIIFSVAPTDGKFNVIFAPLRPFSALQSSMPCLSFIFTPIFLNADRCISIGLGPNSHPPG